MWGVEVEGGDECGVGREVVEEEAEGLLNVEWGGRL
jgi:hypothetical protein